MGYYAAEIEHNARTITDSKTRLTITLHTNQFHAWMTLWHGGGGAIRSSGLLARVACISGKTLAKHTISRP